MVHSGRRYFRVIESPPDGWVCRQGRHELDRHGELVDALAHIREVAARHRPSEVYVHYLDGRVTSAARLD